MPRTLKDPTRSKAIVNDAWETVKRRSERPKWNYIAVVGIVDQLLVDNPDVDGRDISDALALCAENGDTPTRSSILANMKRVQRGRLGTGGFK